MTDDRSPTVELTLAARRQVAEQETLRRRTIATANAVVAFLGRLVRQVFPSQRTAAPFAISPGHAAELTVDIRAPGARGVHLYVESGSVPGGIELDVAPARFVPLDADGRGRALVTASASDERATGQADLRMVAVHPDHPDDIAAELSGIGIAQEGTGALVVTVLGGLLVFGFTVQTVLGGWPVLSAMIFIALTFMALNAPKLERVRFEPRRLLPLRRRLVSSGWALGGMVIWIVAMTANLLSNTGCSLDCGAGDVIVDNLTAIVASFGMATCLALAIAPALRPRQLAGRLLILAAVTPLFFYDLTLVGQRLDAVRTSAWTTGYPALGWGLASVALLWVCLRYRSGRWWQRAALGVLAILGMIAPFVVTATDDIYRWPAIALLLLVCVLSRLALAPGSRWRTARALLFAAAIGALCFFSVELLHGNHGNDGNPGETTPLYGMIVPLVSVLWLLGEVSVWRWWRERRRARRRNRARSTAAESGSTTYADGVAVGMSGVNVRHAGSSGTVGAP